MKTSVICVYNNQQQLEEQLKQSLETQNMEYELIAIDNRDGKFSSAAEALNYGAKVSKGDVLIFSHQDIYLKTEYELQEFVEAIILAGEGAIIGAQGVKEPSKVYYRNATSGKEYDNTLQKQYAKQVYEVSSVDESLFGMLKTTWEQHNFDEGLCDNWHLYSVEACLHARKSGKKVLVYPSQIHHYSSGKISLGYMKNLKLLCKVYRSDFKYIWTTCYKVRTNPFYINGLYCLWVINRFVRGRLE